VSNIKAFIDKSVRYIRRYPVPVLIGLGTVWLLVFDRDSVFYQLKINREIRQLEHDNARLARRIDSTHRLLRLMENPAYLERFAREEWLMRKKNEDLFLIDTTQYEFR